MKAVTFKHFKDNTPAPTAPLGEAPTWEDYLKALGLFETKLAQDKTKAPAFSPVSYKPGTHTRAKENVEAVHCFAVDYDLTTPEDLVAVLEYVTSRNLAYVVYSSFRNEYRLDTFADDKGEGKAEAKVKWRLMLPLQRPVPAAEWPGVWEALQRQLPVRGDESCKDASRIYGLRYTTPERLDASFMEWSDGERLPVPAPVRASGATLAAARPALRTFDGPAEWQEFAEALRGRGKSEKNLWLLACAKAIVKRDAFATQEQGRHQTLIYLTEAMARRWPHIASDVLAESLRVSLTVMSLSQDQFDVEQRLMDVARLIDGAKGLHATFTPSTAPAPRPRPEGAKRSFSDAEPYTDAELLQIAKEQKAPPEETADANGVKAWLQTRWIAHKAGYYWILQLGGYSPVFSKADVLPAVRTRLAAAASAGVALTTLTAAGAIKSRGIDQLIQDYGTPVENLRDVYGEEVSYLTIAPDGTSTLIMKGARMRSDIRPTYNALVHEWLKALFGGPQYEKVLDWLACVPRLTEPVAALYISGPSGVGKNLLTLSLARMFHDGGPVDLAAVTRADGWNGMLLSCPIAVADEQMPEKTTFEGLCEAIGTTTRNLRRKFTPDTTLYGATRIVLTANTEDMLTFRQILTRDQLNAVAKRILHVTVGDEAVDFFAAHPEHRNWLAANAVTAHLMYLAQTRKVEWKQGARFLVEGDASTMTPLLITRNPLFSRIFQWLVRYLAKADRAPATGASAKKAPVLGSDGMLWVNPFAVLDTWTMYVDTHKGPPDIELIQNAIQALCPYGLEPDLDEGYWPVPLKLVLSWARKNGIPDQTKLAKLGKQLTGVEQRTSLRNIAPN